MYIVSFDKITKDDVARVGGKGANLGELTTAGIRVPSGAVFRHSRGSLRCQLCGTAGDLSECGRRGNADPESKGMLRFALGGSCHQLPEEAGV